MQVQGANGFCPAVGTDAPSDLRRSKQAPAYWGHPSRWPDAHMSLAVHSIPARVSPAGPDTGVSGLGCTVWALASLSVRSVVSAQRPHR